MLNSVLVEQFGAIHNQRKSGVLTVVGAGYRLRFCFQNGDPVGMDFCADKQLIIASTMLEFHKIGPELHQHLVDSRAAGKGSVTEMIRRQQVANEEEIGHVTRAMVEDTLCRCFGTMHYEMEFDEADTIDTFDFESSAVRLRIGTDVLLKMVQTRVAEIDKVMNEVGGGGAVFSLSESESGAPPLSDYEKHVLNFVDGHKTLDEIAVSFRESTLNMARLFYGLMGKGVVQRSAGGVSKFRNAIDQVVPMPKASTSSILPAPVYERPEPRSRRSTLASLGFMLLLALGVWFLVYQWRGRNAALDSATAALDDNLAKHLWSEADAQVNKAKQQAGNDLEAIRRASDLEARYSAAVKREQEAVSKLIDARDFTAAHRRLDPLPADEQSGYLRRRLVAGEADFRRRSTVILQQVDQLLDEGKVAEAVAVIQRAPSNDSADASVRLERWRLENLEKAHSATLPISQRMQLITQVMSANPTARQREQVEQIRHDIGREQQRSTDQVHQLKKQSDLGAFVEVETEWDRLLLGAQVHGTPLAAEAEALRVSNDRIKSELTDLQTKVMDMVRDGDDAKGMSEMNAAIEKTLVRYPLASNAAKLRIAAELLNDVAGLIGDANANRSASDEATALDSWLLDRQPTAAVAEAIKGRAARLRRVEITAGEALDRARSFARQSDWEQSHRALEDLIARKEWSHTAARVAATRDLGEAGSLKAQQQAWQEDLDRAMLRGDIDECHRIQQRMGLKYLPLLVQSQPPGAEIWRDGKKIGTAPFTLDIPAGERAALTVELRKPGFITRTVTGAAAENGWYLLARIERQSIASFDLNMTVTARPTVIKDRLWLVNRQQAAALTPAGKPERIAIESSSSAETLGQPLYGAPVAGDDGVYLGTREGICLRQSERGIERLPLGGRTDFSMVVFNSQVIVSRRYLIVAGLDGALHANDDRNPTATWTGETGAAFAAAPRLLGDRVMAVRTTGQIEIYQADDGRLVSRFDLGAPVIAVWPSAEGLAGLTARSAWVSNGKAPEITPLPQEAAIGGEDVFVTADNRVWLRATPNSEWREIGRAEGHLSASPMRWQNQAVLPLGSTLQVMGPHGFTLSARGEFLSPVVIGEHLAVATNTGQAFFYAP